jgi:hypothetical protein
MKTILKPGQKVEIYKEDGLIEGTATLIKLVKKCHTADRPIETWFVRFDDDGEIIQRDISVKLISTPGMSSCLARSPEGKSLLTFMSMADLTDDWIDPKGHDVTAFVSGKILDNLVGSNELVGPNQVNEEILIHLEHSDTSIVINLNTLLVLASSYVRQQLDMADGVVLKQQPKSY